MIFDVFCLVQTIIGMYFLKVSMGLFQKIIAKVKEADISFKGRFTLSVFLTIGTCLFLSIPLSGAIGLPCRSGKLAG